VHSKDATQPIFFGKNLSPLIVKKYGPSYHFGKKIKPTPSIVDVGGQF